MNRRDILKGIAVAPFAATGALPRHVTLGDEIHKSVIRKICKITIDGSATSLNLVERELEQLSVAYHRVKAVSDRVISAQNAFEKQTALLEGKAV